MKTQTRHFPPTAFFWSLGTLTAFSGAALVRLIPAVHYLLHAAGFLLAGLGLLTIAVGVRNRTKRD